MGDGWKVDGEIVKNGDGDGLDDRVDDGELVDNGDSGYLAPVGDDLQTGPELLVVVGQPLQQRHVLGIRWVLTT